MGDKITPAHCPYCLRKLGAAGPGAHIGEEPEPPPGPGSIGLCVYCAKLSMIGPDGNMVKVTDEEFEQLPLLIQVGIKAHQRILNNGLKDEMCKEYNKNTTLN